MKIRELEPELKELEVKIKAIEKTGARQVTSKIDNKFHDVCEALVGDETGCVYLSLWDEDIEKISAGKHYIIKGAYTSLYRHSLRLNISKYGSIKETSESFEVGTNNNLSLKEF